MSMLLLVEDDTWLAQLYRDALEADGHTVVIAATAEKALQVLEESKKPELIILDIYLPGHNGIELLHEIASYPDIYTIPVIILSAVFQHDFGLTNDRWRDYGVVDYLYKPHTKPRQLATVIKKQLLVNSSAL